MTREQWDQLSEDERWAAYNATRPKEGNAIIRVDLELPLETIELIQSQQRLRVSMEPPS